MYLLRPYPDELLGSFLHRATRQLGLSSKRLMPLLSETSNTTLPMLITRHAGFAQAIGLSLEELIQQHTLLPYVVAFMSPAARNKTLGSVLHSSTSSVSAAAQNAIKGSRFLRYCSKCMLEDLQHYGDTYWRRIHQLPGINICATHCIPLFISRVSVRATTTMRPPIEAKGSLKSQKLLPKKIDYEIAELSKAALQNELFVMDWSEHYRSLATKLGYTKNKGAVFGQLLSQDLITFYGRPYLESLNLSYEYNSRAAWPALMFRPHFNSATAVKHILLNVFLDSAPIPSKSLQDAGGKRGKARFNWAQIEIEILTKLKAEVLTHQRAGSRVTLKTLFEKTNTPQILKHNRHKMPHLAKWIEEFKTSPSSERQAGRRPRLYKRNVD